MYEHPMHKKDSLTGDYASYEQKVQCQEQLAAAKKKLMDAKSVLQLDELKCRKRVLRRLGYCTNADVIQLKGRVACELSRYESNFCFNVTYSLKKKTFDFAVVMNCSFPK